MPAGEAWQGIPSPKLETTLSACLSASQDPYLCPKDFGPGSVEEGQRLEKEPGSQDKELGCPSGQELRARILSCKPSVPCSPVDGRDAGHCVIVTDALSQEPVPDLPGEHRRVLSLVFSNFVHHFGRRYFGLGAANHSRLDAASLVVPEPGKAGEVSEKQRCQGQRRCRLWSR